MIIEVVEPDVIQVTALSPTAFEVTITPSPVIQVEATTTGATGLSAYEVWIAEGHTGSEDDFLASLVGAPGASPVLTWVADQIAIDGEVTGPHLTGEPGDPGDPGPAGVGVPSGGTVGQVLTKTGLPDYETAFADAAIPTPTQIGLGNVDNTSDANKPVSIATQTILDAHDRMFAYMQSSGLLWGGALTINGGDATTFDLAAGAAVVVDNYTDPEVPVKTLLTWAAQAGLTDPYLATADTVYVGILSTGVLYFVADDPFTNAQRRTAASFGWLDHVGRTEIEYTGMEPAFINSVAAQLQDFFYAFGAFNLEGNEYTYSALLAIRRTAGSAFCPNQNYINAQNNPHVLATNAEDPAGIWYFYRDVTDWVNDTPLGSEIDPEHYDDGSGTLAAVPTGKWQIQLISYYPLWEANDIQYGQAIYDDLASAESALQDSVEIDPYNSVDVFRGWLMVQQGCTDLSNPATAKFKSAGKLGMFDVQSGGGTGGEVNTASNVGTAGVGIYDAKSGVDLQFRNVGPGSALVTVTLDVPTKTVEIDLATTPEALSNKSTDTALGSSDTLYPSQKAVKDYVDSHSGGISASIAIAYAAALGGV